MSNIRIAQQLAVGYNPDGTPGTITTGVPGPPGPGPADAQVLAAVSTYLQTHPISGVSGSTAGFKKLSTGMVTNDADFSAFGIGVDGSGSWVGIGTYGSTVDGYVVVDGTTTNADLHLKSKGPKGRIWVNSPITTAQPQITLDSDVTVTEDLHVGGQLIFDDTIVGGIVAAEARFGTNSFDSTDGGGFELSNSYVSFAPWGGAGGSAGVAVLNAYTPGQYWSIQASAFTVASDRRWKSEIAPLAGALEEVRTTPAYSYVMGGERRRGLIADEAPADVVRTNAEGYQLIESYDLVGTLWAAVRELADKIEGMEQTCRCPQTR